jgi:AcrR family transcriptional regulator
MAAKKSARKPYHHGDLRPALLRAVGEVLHDHGLEGLSMRECARRAGVSWSAPIHHFGDKTGILTAFAIEGCQLLEAAMQARRLAEPDPTLAAAAVGLAYVEFALDHPQHFRLIFRTELLAPQDPGYQQASRAAYQVLEAAFRACDQALGRPPDTSLPDRCLLAWSAVHGYATLCLEGAIPAPTSHAAPRQARLHTAGTLLGLLGPSLFGPPPGHDCTPQSNFA